MNVLLLSQFFSTTKGGGEYVFSLIAKLLADKGNNVWVITNKIEGEIYPIHENIRIIFVPPVLEYKGGHPPGFKENITYVRHAFKKALLLIKNERVDIIQSNNFAPALVGSLLSLFTSKPHITVIHDVFSLHENFWKNWSKQENVSGINALLIPFFEKIIIRLKAAAIHTVSEASRDDLIRFGAKKPIYVIHNSIESYDHAEVEETPMQFIYIGRLVFYKNLEVVFRSIKIVKQKYPKVKLIVVGNGPHRKNLEKLVTDLNLQDNIEFKGHVSEPEKRLLLASSQALIFPSFCEGFGLVILEAFACRKPALVANVRPSSDIVDASTGIVTAVDSVGDWAAAIEKIITNPTHAHEIGINGRKILEEKYNSDIMFNKLLKMYNDIIKRVGK